MNLQRPASPFGPGHSGGPPCYASPVAPARQTSTDEDGLAALYRALDELRVGGDPLSARHDAAWRTVSRWVRDRTPLKDRRADDVAQETLLAIARHVVHMDAATPRQAAKWASTILRRKHIDVLRTDANDPIDKGLGEQEGTLEGVGAGDTPVPAHVLDAQHRRLEEVILAHIEATEPSATIRLTRRSMARAALYRLVVDLEPDAVESRLGLPEPVGKDRLYKWIERGRTVVADAMRAWSTRLPEEADVQALSAVVIELVEARRADAGRPRPERRRP